MQTATEFTPMSKEKWAKTLLSTDPNEKTAAMQVLKAAANHNGLRTIAAYMSKNAEEKAEIIWSYQQETNPYKNGASAPASAVSDSNGAATDDTEEEEPKAKRRTVKRRKRRTKAEMAEARKAEAAAEEPEESDEEGEEAEATAHSAPEGNATIQLDMGPVMAELNELKEALIASEVRQDALAESFKKVLGRLSDLDKWVKETHCILRISALSHEGVYDNLANKDIVDEFYGTSAFDEESEGN